MDNVALITKGYELFGQGDIPGVLELWDDNIKWMGAKSFPVFEGGDGIVIGPQNVVEVVLSKIPELYDDFNIDIQAIFGVGNKVVMEGYYTGVWKESGKPFKSNAVHIWDVENGKAVRYFQAVDTAEIMN